MEENSKDYNSLRIAIPTEFETVFSHFYFAENKSSQPITKTLLPTFQTIFIFCFGDKVSLSTKQNGLIEVDKCSVLGPFKQAIEYTLPVHTSILVANLKDDAFYRFFGISAINNHLQINTDNFLPENCFTNLWYQLQKINSVTEKVNFILAFCKPYLRSQHLTSELLSNFKDETMNPIKVVAEQINQTERSIQIKQKEQFGYSSKEILRYQRFLKAIKLIELKIEKSKKVEWFEIIGECNYYDQSQLINDFKHFINLSPTKYLKFQKEICKSNIN